MQEMQGTTSGLYMREYFKKEKENIFQSSVYWEPREKCLLVVHFYTTILDAEFLSHEMSLC